MSHPSSGKTQLFVKSLWIGALVIVVALAGYWVKCQLGINIFPDISWEKNFAFLNSFQRNDRVARSAPGMVFTSTFDELLPRHNWGNVWARDKGTVQADIVPAGLNGSKALRIRSASVRGWAFPSRIQLEVRPGDTFEFSGYARTSAEATSHMSVTLYDALDKVTVWDGAAIKIKYDSWQLYTKRFVVPEGAVRVCILIAGNGVGSSYFDDIAFHRVK